MKSPLDKKEAEELIHKAAEEKNIQFADQDFTEEYRPECHEILLVLIGSTSAWISNRSSVGNFFCHPEENEAEAKKIEELTLLSGLESISNNTELWRIAEAMRNSRNPKMSS